jgi:hypothetical protein
MVLEFNPAVFQGNSGDGLVGDGLIFPTSWQSSSVYFLSLYGGEIFPNVFRSVRSAE